MLRHPDIDPVAVQLGPLAIHWYGLMYLMAFGFAWWLAARRSQQSWRPVAREQVDDLIFYGAIGVILGGRFGYVLFYNFDQFLAQPLWLFKVGQGGMSFPGGLLGVLVAMAWCARRQNIRFGALMDFVAPLVPVGLGLGRLGNFIGQECSVAFDGIEANRITSLEEASYNNLLKVAVDYSDAVILAAEDIPEELTAYVEELQKPTLPYVPIQEFEEAYTQFYTTEVLK